MKVNYNIQKEERKAMVAAVGKALDTKPAYCGAPSFSYKVGVFEITKDGSLCFDDATDKATVARVCTALREAGSRPRTGRTKLPVGTQGRMSRSRRSRRWKSLPQLMWQRSNRAGRKRQGMNPSQ